MNFEPLAQKIAEEAIKIKNMFFEMGKDISDNDVVEQAALKVLNSLELPPKACISLHGELHHEFIAGFECCHDAWTKALGCKVDALLTERKRLMKSWKEKNDISEESFDDEPQTKGQDMKVECPDKLGHQPEYSYQEHRQCPTCKAYSSFTWTATQRPTEQSELDKAWAEHLERDERSRKIMDSMAERIDKYIGGKEPSDHKDTENPKLPEKFTYNEITAGVDPAARKWINEIIDYLRAKE